MLQNRKIFFFILFFVLFGCIKKVPVNLPMGDQLPSEESIYYINAITNKQQKIRSVKSLYSTNLEYGGKRDRYRQLIVYQAPDNLHLEILPTTGAYSLGMLISKSNRTQFIEGNTGEIKNSDSAEDLLYETVRYKADVNELISVLLGMLPMKYSNDLSKIKVFQFSESELSIFTGDGKYNVVVSKDQNLPLKMQILDKNAKYVLLNIEYSEYRKHGNHEQGDFEIPHLIKINFVQDELLVNLKLSYFEANTPISGKMFQFVN